MNYGSLPVKFSFDPVKNSRHFLLLFLVWPFLAFITALANYDRKEARKMIYIFLIYYGFTYVIQQAGGDGADAVRYALYMRNNAERPFSDFFKIIGGLYTNETSMDIVEPFISFIVSRITSYHGILFAAYAALFGFFYLKALTCFMPGTVKTLNGMDSYIWFSLLLYCQSQLSTASGCGRPHGSFFMGRIM